MIICCFIAQPETLIDKILPTIISATVVLSIFLIGRYFDSKLRSKEIKRNWYLNIIVSPNIDKVEDFIAEVLLSVNKSIDTLILAKGCKSTNYNGEKAIEIGKFQEIKREFEFSFILLVKSGAFTKSEEMGKLLRGLEDIITTILDNSKLQVSCKEDLTREIKYFKYNFYKVLYEQIK